MKKQQRQRRIPNIHPGEILLEEFLQPLNISAYKLARETYMPESRISEIINGNRSISADTAMRLSQYFGNSAKFWLGLQIEYDVREIKRADSHVYEKIQQYRRKGS